MSITKVVDLGSKTGESLDAFFNEGAAYFGAGIKKIERHNCLAVDLNEGYRTSNEKKGYQFKSLNILNENGTLPYADYYLAWDFLEHLPDKTYADSVLSVMSNRCRKAVWLRMPSFENDHFSGEGKLKDLGLRFSWTKWSGHPNPYLISNAVSVLVPQMSRVIVQAKKFIYGSSDPWVVPVDSPLDTEQYCETLGAKNHISFNPPIVRVWDVIGIR